MFIANEDELLLRNNQFAEEKAARARRREESDDDDDEEEEEVVGKDKGEGEEEGEGAKEGTKAKGEISEEDEEMLQKAREERDARAAKAREAKAAKDAAKAAKGAAKASDAEAPESVFGVIKAAVNPNFAQKQEKQVKVKDLKNMADFEVNPESLSRKEREALEEARKKEEYMKRHLALQTEEAKRDMERLRIVKERREEAAKKTYS